MVTSANSNDIIECYGAKNKSFHRKTNNYWYMIFSCVFDFLKKIFLSMIGNNSSTITSFLLYCFNSSIHSNTITNTSMKHTHDFLTNNKKIT